MFAVGGFAGDGGGSLRSAINAIWETVYGIPAERRRANVGFIVHLTTETQRQEKIEIRKFELKTSDWSLNLLPSR
jgi:hypothetical protein